MGSLWARARAAFRFDVVPPEDISQVPSRALVAALGGAMSRAGVSVSREAILSIPEVEACLRVISQAVARCPLKLRARDAGGGWVDAEQSPLWEILHDLPNPEQTATAFRAQMTRDLIAYERAFAQVVRRPSGQVMSLWRLDPMRMTVDRDEQNRKRYTYQLADGQTEVWTFDADRPPILDLEYASPIGRCRELWGLALAVEQYASAFFANGARLSGLLSSPQDDLDDETVRDLREQFRAMSSGVANAHGIGVVTGGMSFTPIAAENDKAQLLELRKLVGHQICGVMGVPPHKIADLERATFSNIEHQDREFVANTCDPMFVLWEQSIRRDLLTTRQYPNYRAVFAREALIQTDTKARLEAIAVGRQNGIYSVNDSRRKLEENLIPASAGGDLYHMNGNMVTLTGGRSDASGSGLELPGASGEPIGQVM